MKQWGERAPEVFTFAAKVPQIITREKMLVDVEDDLKAFLGMTDLLGDKLGPLLFQFPYFNKQKFRGVGFFLERLEALLKQLPKDHQWVVEIKNKNQPSEKCYSVLRQHGVALALVDHVWMPRLAELFETGNTITGDFTFVPWIGDRKGIEECTKIWNQTIIDRIEDLREWVKIFSNVARRVTAMFAYANNDYGEYTLDTIELFKTLWPQEQTANLRPTGAIKGEASAEKSFAFRHDD